MVRWRDVDILTEEIVGVEVVPDIIGRQFPAEFNGLMNVKEIIEELWVGLVGNECIMKREMSIYSGRFEGGVCVLLEELSLGDCDKSLIMKKMLSRKLCVILKDASNAEFVIIIVDT